jgi:threonine/homoserine/homoserine lactone efflux protein
VAYLVYLGLREWRRALRRNGDGMVAPMPAARGVFWQGVLVALTNPKTIFFYLAFFPQFLDGALPAAPQLVLMSVSFVMIAILLDSIYALLAGRLRPLLMDGRRARIRHGITGTLLLGTGLGLALARRGS